MNGSKKILNLLSSIVESGILTSEDLKKEIKTNLKFNRDKLVDKLDLVSREEFNILKKIIEKQQKEINELKKKQKKQKKLKR